MRRRYFSTRATLLARWLLYFFNGHVVDSGWPVDALAQLGAVSLAIPAWQMALYLCVLSFYEIVGKIRGCLLTTYVSAFYFGYYLYAHDLMAATHGNPTAQAVYYGFALALGGCVLMTFFYEER